MKKIPFSENFENLNPSSLYGKTKLANEIIAHNNKNLKTIGLRFFTVFGPWEGQIWLIIVLRKTSKKRIRLRYLIKAL